MDFFWSPKEKHRLVFLFFGMKFRPEKNNFNLYEGFSWKKKTDSILSDF
jgi:hypothetical protein